MRRACPHCNHPNPDDALFCAHCGKRMTIDESTPTAISTPLEASTTDDTTPASSRADEPTQMGVRKTISDTNAALETGSTSHEMPFISALPLPTESASGQVPSASGTPQLPNVPQAPGTPGQMPSAPAATGAVSKGIGTKAAGGFLQSLGAKIIIGVLIVAVASAVAIRVIPKPSQPGNQTQAHQAAQNTPTPTPEVTLPMPATQTSCPAANTARPAVTAPLKLGQQNTLIYRDWGKLMAYNAETKKSTTLAGSQQPNDEAFSSPQVSADGKWIVFERTPGEGDDPNFSGMSNVKPLTTTIQMIRADGQGLQTLYCPARNQLLIDNGDMALSPHAQLLAFHQAEDAQASNSNERDDLYVLNLSTGRLQDVLPYKAGEQYWPLLWLDDNQLYLDHVSNNQSQELLLLNLKQESTRQITSANELGTPLNWQIALNSDHSKLYIKTRNQITVRPPQGGAAKTLYSSTADQVIQLVAGQNEILFSTGSVQGYRAVSNLKIWRLKDGDTTPQAIDTTNVKYVGDQAISPDGKWLVYMADPSPADQGNMATSGQQIHVRPLDGGNEAVVARTGSGLGGAGVIYYGLLDVVGWTHL